MNLIKCSCCEKLISASQAELTFLRPDVIANLSKEERAQRCEGNGDLYVLDSNRYFLRGLIPLPVIETKSNYCLGAWVELDKRDYERVIEKWDEEDLSSEPLIHGKLANEIPYSRASVHSDLNVKLVSNKSRPFFYLLDQSCSLFSEQKNGISIHRALEFAQSLNKDRFIVIEEEELESSVCSCCKGLIRLYCGRIENTNHDIEGDYWLRIPEGHAGIFTIAISISKNNNPRVAVLLGENKDGALTYWIQQIHDSPWEDFGSYGKVMDRDEVLNDQYKNLFFDLIDKISASDTRLRPHIGR